MQNYIEKEYIYAKMIGVLLGTNILMNGHGLVSLILFIAMNASLLWDENHA